MYLSPSSSSFFKCLTRFLGVQILFRIHQSKLKILNFFSAVFWYLFNTMAKKRRQVGANKSKAPGFINFRFFIIEAFRFIKIWNPKTFHKSFSKSKEWEQFRLKCIFLQQKCFVFRQVWQESMSHLSSCPFKTRPQEKFRNFTAHRKIAKELKMTQSNKIW